MQEMRDFSQAPARQVFIETFGCQMNDNDSTRMLGLLEKIRYVRTDLPERADLILVNTCSIRDKAEQKVYSTLGRFRALKQARPGLIIGVSGCVAQQHGERLLNRVPHLDMVLGPHNLHRLGELIERVESRGERVAATAQSAAIAEGEYGVAAKSAGVKASISIMRGCDNFCSYCIVPYTRGREVSRTAGEILSETAALARTGVKEVTLLGQNVNSYGKKGGSGAGFAELLRRVCMTSGIKRVRFITSHPKDVSDALVDLFDERPELCRHIHLPVQSGSDTVLGAMRRGYTRDEYLEMVLAIKERYPDMAVTTDVIVGFPGETEACFSETMDLIEHVGFDNIFSFMYSPRPGTDAAGFGDAVPADVKSTRLRVLQERQREITSRERSALVGRTLGVLVEGASKTDGAELTGRTGCNRIVNFAAPRAVAGEIVDVCITGVMPNSLRGEPCVRPS